jgi:hypothetical protein
MLVLFLNVSCRLDPSTLMRNRGEYNRAIQLSNEEQLLLNLVRIKYRESPLFLDVGSVSAQFSLEKGASISGRYSSHQPADASLFGLGTNMAVAERPTITYTPLQGNAYAERLMTPLTLDTVMLLFYSGWKIDRILRLTVQQINNVRNAPRAAGPTPAQSPVYEDFQDFTQAMADLQAAGLLNLGYEVRETSVLTTMPADLVTIDDVVAADEKKYKIQETEGRNAYSISKQETVPVLRVAASGNTAIKQDGKFAGILGVAKGMRQYDLKEAFSVQGEGDDFHYNELAIGMRSLIGVLFYLSQGVEIPQSHVDQGLVTVTRNDDGSVFDWTKVTGGLLRVHTSPKRPKNAPLSVEHRGHWFYIKENDLSSKSTMVLLLQLFALRAGGGDVAAPVLTLPLGN